jgi:hypothetical protein
MSTTLSDEVALGASPRGWTAPSAPAVPLDPPLLEAVREYVDLAARAEAPLALLLVVPMIRRPTGQRLDRRMEVVVRRDVADLIESCLHHADRMIMSDHGVIGIVLRGASVIGAIGVEKRILRRFEAIRVLAGRDVRIGARTAFSVFPDEAGTAESLIRVAQRRFAATG